MSATPARAQAKLGYVDKPGAGAVRNWPGFDPGSNGNGPEFNPRGSKTGPLKHA